MTQMPGMHLVHTKKHDFSENIAGHCMHSTGLHVNCGVQAPGGSEAEMAYKRLQAICAAMRQELDSDLRIHETRKLPNWIVLPQITAAEYGKVGICQVNRLP